MAVNIIDGGLHGSAFPATYTGPGNLIGNCIQSLGKMLAGFCTSVSGNTIQINCGFAPLAVTVCDMTGNLEWYWQVGFPANSTLKYTLGTIAGVVDTTGQITVTTDPAGNAQVNLGLTLCGAAKLLSFQVIG